MNPRRALVFIFCTVTLDVLALGLMIPVLPKLVLGFVGGDTAAAAEMFGLFTTVWGLMQFLFSPLLGALSDRFGRRPVLLISCLGLGLDYIFMAVAPSLTLLLIGRIVSGITAATATTAFAYITDVTRPEGRAAAFGRVGIAFGLGFILGPALGGVLSEVSPRLPFWLSAAACLANAAFGWFVLPESLPLERRMAFSWRRGNPIGSLALLRTHRELWGLGLANLLSSLAHEALPAVFVLYAGYRYGWNQVMVGLTLGFVGLCSALVQGLLVGPAVAWLGARRAAACGLFVAAVGMAIFGLAHTGTWFWAGVPVMALWSLAGPAINDIMSRRVSPSEQGQLQGANNSARSLASLVAPGIFSLIFAHLLDSVPGAPFLLAAGLLLASAATSWVVTKPRPAAVPLR